MIQTIFDTWIHKLGGHQIGEIKAGLHKKSLGQCLILEGKHVWIQVASHKHSLYAERYKKRLMVKDTLNIKAPRLLTIEDLGTLECDGETLFFTGCIMTWIQSPPISKTPELRSPVALSPSFLKDLRQTLEKIESYETSDINVRQDLITRRLKEFFGPIPHEIKHWKTTHGDLHWANIAEDGSLFDWETFGRGPCLLDPAFLYVFSLAQKEVCAAIAQIFPELFHTQDGLLCLLFACAEFLRMNKIYGDYEDLAPLMRDFSEKLLKEKGLK